MQQKCELFLSRPLTLHTLPWLKTKDILIHSDEQRISSFQIIGGGSFAMIEFFVTIN
jgi:hypothetical protein